MNFSFLLEAEKEFLQAVEYYNECQKDLGFDFAREVYKSIDHILSFPHAWSKFSKNTRRCITDRFPYGVIYKITHNEIIIIAIMQMNKHPKHLNKRL